MVWFRYCGRTHAPARRRSITQHKGDLSARQFRGGNSNHSPMPTFAGDNRSVGSHSATRPSSSRIATDNLLLHFPTS